MAQQMVTTKVIGLEKLSRSIGEDIPQEFKRMMFKIRGHAQKQAKERAKPHVGDVGSLANTIRGATVISRMTARIWTNLPVAVEAEQGRRPGNPPSSRALQRWMKRHGLAADWRSVRAVRKMIEARGTQGVRFMEGAGEDTRQHLPEFIAEAEAAIKRAWDKAA